jgi:hypothetical protein
MSEKGRKERGLIISDETKKDGEGSRGWSDFAPQALGLLALKAVAEQSLLDLREIDVEFVCRADCQSAPEVVGCCCPRCRCDRAMDRIQAFASSIIRSCDSALDDAGEDDA